MSEYQYYEFLALDKPLTREQRAELRSISRRAASSRPWRRPGPSSPPGTCGPACLATAAVLHDAGYRTVARHASDYSEHDICDIR